MLINIKLIASGVTGAMLQHAAKLAEVGNSSKQELLPRPRKMAELSVLEKICKKLTVIEMSVPQVIVTLPLLQLFAKIVPYNIFPK